jgi:hypothetical protein
MPGAIKSECPGGFVGIGKPHYRGARMNIIPVPVGLRQATRKASWFFIDGQREEDMPFIASNGLTEAGTSKTIAAGGMNVHYHNVGEGEPVLFLHSYGPGTTAWITFHKTIGALSQHFRSS